MFTIPHPTLLMPQHFEETKLNVKSELRERHLIGKENKVSNKAVPSIQHLTLNMLPGSKLISQWPRTQNFKLHKYRKPSKDPKPLMTSSLRFCRDRV